MINVSFVGVFNEQFLTLKTNLMIFYLTSKDHYYKNNHSFKYIFLKYIGDEYRINKFQAKPLIFAHFTSIYNKQKYTNFRDEIKGSKIFLLPVSI